jgi:hypothetical protein
VEARIDERAAQTELGRDGEEVAVLGDDNESVGTSVSGSSGEATECAPALEGDDGDLVFGPWAEGDAAVRAGHEAGMSGKEIGEGDDVEGIGPRPAASRAVSEGAMPARIEFGSSPVVGDRMVEMKDQTRVFRRVTEAEASVSIPSET